jgi:tetratricopeptide (TPR) repeat protein
MLVDVLWGSPLMTLHVVLLAAIIVQPHCSPARFSGHLARWISPVVIVAVVGALVWTDCAHYFQHRAVQAAHEEDFAAAADALHRAVLIDPFLPIYRFQLGVAQGYQSLRQDDAAMLRDAVAAFEAELSRGGDTAINNANLAWLRWTAEDSAEAIKHIERAAALAPRTAYYQQALGFLLEDIGDPTAAAEAYTTAIRLQPDLIDSGFWQANSYRRDLKADLLAADDFPAQTQATLAYFVRDDVKAVQLLESLPQSTGLLVLRGQIETEQRDYEAALGHLNAAVALDHANPKARLARGHLYVHLGEETRARRDFRAASFLGQGRADIALGELAYQAGDLDRAIARYRMGIPACRTPEPYYYADLVYHRADLHADFWPDSVACAPHDGLATEYLHMARAYRRTGQSEYADDLCRWLADFYEPAYLMQFDDEDEATWPCPHPQQWNLGS